MELQKINEDNKIIFQTHDYLYHHNKASYPSQNERTLESLYLITGVSDNKIKILNFYDSKEQEILSSELEIGYWYYYLLPSIIRKSLGIGCIK